jgi:hypothetical protein
VGPIRALEAKPWSLNKAVSAFVDNRYIACGIYNTRVLSYLCGNKLMKDHALYYGIDDWSMLLGEASLSIRKKRVEEKRALQRVKPEMLVALVA